MFERPYNRSLVTGPGIVRCVCGARAGYVLRRGATTLYRCPACANNYTAPEWQAEALPHIAAAHAELIYGAYALHRGNGFTPDQIGRDFRATFEGRVEQLEARYQAELAGKSRAS